MLETWHPCYVSAKGFRKYAPESDIGTAEWIISGQVHAGQSGAPVVSRENGRVIGIVRGSLSPPEVIAVGGLSIGTDSSVTFAAEASIVPTLVADAFKGVEK